MPPAVAAGIGLGGAALNYFGQKKANKQQNAYLGQAAAGLDPSAIMQSSGQLNPWLMSALQGQSTQGGSGYGQELFNIAQNPGYIDPQVMNMPFHLSAQRGNQDMQRAQSILGKTQSGAASGVGNAYAMANQMGRTSRDVGTAQQYSLWREQQKRADIGMLQQMLAQTQGLASGNAQQQGQYYAQQQAGPNWMTGLGSMAGAGLAAYAPFAGGGGGQQQSIPGYSPGGAGSMPMPNFGGGQISPFGGTGLQSSMQQSGGMFGFQ